MNRLLLLLLVALAACAAVSAATPDSGSSVIWPLSWTSAWNFVNITNNQLINSGIYYVSSPSVSSSQIRVDNHNCNHFLNRSTFCTEIMTLDNNLYIRNDDMGVCCLLFPGVGPTVPDWLKGSTYNGAVHNPHYNFMLDEYHHEPLKGFEEWYYAKAGTNIPVILGGGETWIKWLDVQVGPQDASLFALDASCKQACSSAPLPEGLQIVPNMESPLLRHVVGK